MDRISVGLLLPSSTILPISKDFESGLKDGFGYKNKQLEVELIKEFIGSGGIKQVEDACNRFFHYYDTDLVTGVVSNKAAESISIKFKNKKKPLIVNNLGGHIPNPFNLNEYIFINSLHLWKHAWCLGNWGVKELGRKGMFIGAVYDAGYSFSQMFQLGMKAADPESEWSFAVPPMPEDGKLTDMSFIFPFLEKYQPDFVFAAFCGEETSLFINEFIRRGWHERTKLLGLPFLLAPFNSLIDDVIVYTSSLFGNNEEIPAEKSFYHLGFQTGFSITEAAINSNGTDLNQQIQKVNAINAEQLLIGDKDNIVIVENEIKKDQDSFLQKQIKLHVMPAFSTTELQELFSQISTAWLNPYLGI